MPTAITFQTVSKKTTIQTITLDQLLDRIGRHADLLQMDVQGVEAQILSGGSISLELGKIKEFLISTHSPDIHRQCLNTLVQFGYSIELEKTKPNNRADGIIIAAKGAQRP